jgi:hypothetical protein
MGEESGPPIVALPERLDRKLRFGPFPSGRDALKFVTYAAAGAVLVPFLGAMVWIPFVLGGLAVSMWRPDGEGIDARALSFLRWKIRSVAREERMKVPRSLRGSVIPLTTGGFAAILRTGGLPIAFLPPAELHRTFERFRELLRAIDGGFFLLVARAPIHAAPLLPAEPCPVGDERLAREGYRELVEVIVRRRYVRQVYVGLSAPRSGPEGLARLESRVTVLSEHLVALGLRPVRLRHWALGEAARRMKLIDGGTEG